MRIVSPVAFRLPEKLLLGVGAQEGHAPHLRLVLPARVAPLGDGNGADVGKIGARAGDEQGAGVVGAPDRSFPAEFGHGVLAVRRLLKDDQVVRGPPPDPPAGPGPAGLQARPPGEDDQDVLAEVLRHPGLADPGAPRRRPP